MNIERLLISARAVDRSLWSDWLTPYGPPDGIFAISDPNGNRVARVATNEQHVWGLLKKSATPLNNGAAVIVDSVEIVYVRVLCEKGQYAVLPAVFENGAFHSLQPIGFDPDQERKAFVGILQRRDGTCVNGFDEQRHSNYCYSLLVDFINATMLHRRAIKCFSAARRPSVARSGWLGVKYTVCELDAPATQPAAFSAGTHASPRFHWVRGYTFERKDGRLVVVRPKTRGDKSRGEVIKDWVREMGLAA